MIPLFDRYIAVDWSGSNSPSWGKDSIWIGQAIRGDGSITVLPSQNPRTRTAAMAALEQVIVGARKAGERVLVGFDFAFGFPAGSARIIAGEDHWEKLWGRLSELVTDDENNKSNNYAVADALNATFPQPGPRFWGRPSALNHTNLATNKAGAIFDSVPERRIVERLATGTKAIWQLHYNGAVGSQAMLGIPRIEHLRNQSSLRNDIAIWPFDTDFERALKAPVVVVEIYPSLFDVDPLTEPLDRAQVESVAQGFARFDARGELAELLSAPADLTSVERATVLREEGWIVGAGRTDLKVMRPSPARPLRPRGTRAVIAYLRDPDLIYAQSFATIRAEADLTHLPAELHDPAIRMIHACGMVDLAADITGDPTVVAATQAALRAGAPVLCDCEMVRAGIIRRHLPEATELLLTLNAPNIAELAKLLATTRSAAAVELWRPRLAGAVVLIGNAPTALFHLLETLDERSPRPAAIIATPVGFVGAAESKALLAANRLSIPFLTVRGRRGGSAIASAAFNAISKGLGS